MTTQSASRWSKISMLAAIALFFTLVVYNNLADFESNHEFVRHTLSMDTTFPGNHGMGRAITNPTVQLVFYVGIIAWETLNAVLLWWGSFELFRSRHAAGSAFHHSKRIGILGLTAGLLQWLVAFETIGGEWFLMWQSKTWNGQEAAFRMFTIEGIILLLLLTHEPGSAVASE